MRIENVSKKYYPQLIEIWETSVRATHDFLTEKDILMLKPLVLDEYFPAVELRCIRDKSDKIIGFIGIAEKKIEMLFIAPNAHGKGAGKQLVEHAIKVFDADRVDVNEQNLLALGFYEHIGFTIESRSELDGQGMPFPLLHMVLRKE